MQQIVVPSVLLTGIVLVLSLVVLLARHLLTASGTVSISVNDRRVLNVAAGRRLLWALAGRGIYLPAACGGKGACGQCRVRIDEGCPDLLPTEAQHIEQDDAATGFRLACMVRVREDMHISIDAKSLDVGHWNCEVVSNQSIAIYVKELVLRLPEHEHIEFEAGDYVLVEVPPYGLGYHEFEIGAPFREEWERLGLFDLESNVTETTVRAYSPANPPQQDQEVRLVIKIATPPAIAPANTPPGRASSYLFGLKPGDRLTLSGPFGTFNATANEKEMVLIAGGAGIAPIRSIILDQLARRTSRKMSLWFGARDLHDLCYYNEFEDLARAHGNFRVHAVLSNPAGDDGWTGDTGFVHTVVHEKFLKDHRAPAEAEYYLCGPPLMAEAVLQMLDKLGVEPDNIFLDDFGS